MPALAKYPDYGLTATIWDRGKIMEALYQSGVLLATLPKDTGLVDAKTMISTGYSQPQGIGTSYTGAKFTKSTSSSVEWEITHKHYHGTFGVDGYQQRLADKGGKSSLLVDIVGRESTGLIEQCRYDISRAIYGNGGGALGVISAISGQRVTLATTRDSRAIRKGMTLQFASTDGTSGSVEVGTVKVAKVGKGYFDVSEASVVAGIPTAATTMYVFRYDTFGGMITGLKAWLPAWDDSTPPGTLKGVDRNQAPPELAGTYVDGRGLGPRARIEKALLEVSDNGAAKPDLYVMSTTRWGQLRTEQAALGALVNTKVPSAKVGKISFGIEYSGIEIIGPKGPVDVVADPECGDDDEWVLQKNTWTIGSMGDLLYWDKKSIREDGADAYETSLVGDFEMYCKCPFFNGRVRCT